MAATAEAPPVHVDAAGEFPYRFAVLRLDECFVDASYQRPLTSFVNRIKTKFDPALVGCLVVSQRRKLVKVDRLLRRYALIDGQTRWAAMGDLGFEEVPCVVFEGLSQGQEADLFARLQKERRGVLSYHRFRADLVAEKEEPLAINRIVEEAGYEIGPSGGAGVIPAVAALEAVYRRSPEVLERALVIFKQGWADRWMFEGSHLKGLGYFLQRNPDCDDERMARRLSIVSPDELKRRASAVREGQGLGGGSDKYMASAIEGVYKRGKER